MLRAGKWSPWQSQAHLGRRGGLIPGTEPPAKEVATASMAVPSAVEVGQEAVSCRRLVCRFLRLRPEHQPMPPRWRAICPHVPGGVEHGGQRSWAWEFCRLVPRGGPAACPPSACFVALGTAGAEAVKRGGGVCALRRAGSVVPWQPHAALCTQLAESSGD